jgi:hypothetical protein
MHLLIRRSSLGHSEALRAPDFEGDYPGANPF